MNQTKTNIMRTSTGLTIETKGNVINVYTDEDIARGKIVESRTNNILTSIGIGLSIGGVFTFYALVFGLI